MNARTIVVGFSIILMVAVGASAQSVTLTAAEYDKAVQTAMAASASKTRRETTISRGVKGGKVFLESTDIDEFVMPDRHRSLSVETISGMKSTEETIEVAGKSYRKSDDGKWSVGSFESKSKSDQDLPKLTPEQIGVSKYVSQDGVLDGKTVRVLKRLNVSRVDGVREGVIDTTYVGIDGLILKRDLKTIEGEGTADYLSEITTYEYTPKDLSIEAPIK